MSKTIVAWLETEMTALMANIHRHQGVGPYITNCERWEIHLEAYQKLYDVLRRKAVSLDKNASCGKAKRPRLD